MKERFINYRLFRVLCWSLLATLLLTFGLLFQPSDMAFSIFGDNTVYAQEGDGDSPGQGLCPDGVTAVPGGVDKIKFCRDNGQAVVPPVVPPAPGGDFIDDLWCNLIARFRMFKPVGLTYEVICLEEAPPLPPGIREVDFRIVTVIRDSDNQIIKDHSPPLVWRLINRDEFAGTNDTVVLLRWNEDVEPNRWEFVPGSENSDRTIDYSVSETSLFAVGLTDDPNIVQTLTASETVIPAGLPRTGKASVSTPWAVPWGAGLLAATGLAVLTAVGLWRWREH